MIDMLKSEVESSHELKNNLAHSLTRLHSNASGMVENRVNSTDPVVQAR